MGFSCNIRKKFDMSDESYDLNIAVIMKGQTNDQSKTMTMEVINKSAVKMKSLTDNTVSPQEVLQKETHVHMEETETDPWAEYAEYRANGGWL